MAYLGKRRVVGLREGRGLLTSHTGKRHSAGGGEREHFLPPPLQVSHFRCRTLQLLYSCCHYFKAAKVIRATRKVTLA